MGPVCCIYTWALYAVHVQYMLIVENNSVTAELDINIPAS